MGAQMLGQIAGRLNRAVVTPSPIRIDGGDEPERLAPR
jgi:hypothetical protein